MFLMDLLLEVYIEPNDSFYIIENIIITKEDPELYKKGFYT
jgi:hypothetical protein